jgi:hypothetical protein
MMNMNACTGKCRGGPDLDDEIRRGPKGKKGARPTKKINAGIDTTFDTWERDESFAFVGEADLSELVGRRDGPEDQDAGSDGDELAAQGQAPAGKGAPKDN